LSVKAEKILWGKFCILYESRGLLRAGQALDEVGLPAYSLQLQDNILILKQKSDLTTLNTFLMLTLMMVF
jgi:hypothetical protein